MENDTVNIKNVKFLMSIENAELSQNKSVLFIKYSNYRIQNTGYISDI